MTRILIYCTVGKVGNRGTQFNQKLYILRDVERRPVLCSFKRIEGGSAYQKNLLRKIRLYILHSSAASLPSIRVPRPRKHPRVSRVALSARAC